LLHLLLSAFKPDLFDILVVEFCKHSGHMLVELVNRRLLNPFEFRTQVREFGFDPG
jgi:hypothetical protein